VSEPATVEAALVDGIVRVTIKGTTGILTGGEAVMKALWCAKGGGVRGILFDMREAFHPAGHAEVIKHAANAPIVGITAYPIAILGRADDPILEFIDDVAINRGFRAKTFTDPQAAQAWLAENRRKA
jgi:hypothetical protein